ncbi:unnamed protein product [Phaedon cochleariae]|uniref:Integrin alpha-PS2 n=1 Tax=Phaedon cochleariae TaxID=80249 RepID=A0A9P0DKU5_PHACE|nr:unnamed protein product [Phaedon cochleariae]
MCECKLILCAFLVSNVILVTCFNIDQENFAVYEFNTNGSMFGFTVAVHKDRGNRGWVLVGAPEAQSIFQDRTRRGAIKRGGAVYKCRSDSDDVCQEVPFDTSGNDGLDEKSGQWFGATLSSSGQTDGPIVACAPRYVWYTRDLNRRDPVGTCFVSNGAFDHFEEYSPCRTMNWGYHRQGSCQAGFSAAINRDGDRLFVGAPGSYYWQGQMYSIDAHATFNFTPGYFGKPGYGAEGSVHQQSLERRPAVFSTREGKPPDDDSYIGYSTVVGHFQEGQEYEGAAVGMPRGNKLKGKVLLFTWDLINYKNLTISKQIGSYFGYSLAAADVNGDKKLDLIVGAPMHTEANNEGSYDVGRVYVFYQASSAAESFNTSHYIDGMNSKGRFGLSLASLGDLNQDGFDDFAVGAPYDGPNGRGAVYIYYGSKEGIRQKHGQVIFAEDIHFNHGPTTTFGFSLAGGMDLDGNEYPDMAVGAYLSDAAFFFRARPVVLIDGYVRFQTPQKQIDIKEKNCKLPNGQDGTCTAIDFCIKYTGKGIPDQLYLTVQYILDTKKPSTPRMGFLTRGTYTFNDTLLLYKDNKENCKTEQVYVKSEIRDKLTPLEAEVKLFMSEDRSISFTRNPQSLLKPVLDLNNPPSRKDSIVVQKNCGPDNICVPNLHVNITANVNKYLLGSNRNLEFDVIVSNFNEDAYETTFELKYPEGIFYKKIDTMPNSPGILCSSRENRTVVCDVGNPLPAGRIASFKVLLQPYYKEGMPPSYEFDVFVNSTNPEPEETMADNHHHISINIWIDAFLELRGESYPPTVYFNESLYAASTREIKKESDIGPQITHVYYIGNRGPATIQEAEVFLLWPLKTLGEEDLLYLLDQPHTLGNVKCDAAPSNYRHFELDYHRASIWERLKIDTSSIGVTASELKNQGKTTETGGGISSGVGVVNEKTNIDKEISSGGDSSSVFERRHNETNLQTWGTLNPDGEYEYKEAKYFTAMVNGIPVTRWENKTTIRDSKGNILRTFYYNDNTNEQVSNVGSKTGLTLAAGEYEHKESKYYTRWVDGKQVTTWENKTIVTDANGNILRSYYWNDETGEIIPIPTSGGTYGRGSGSFNYEEENLSRVTTKPHFDVTERTQEELRAQEQLRILEERRKMEEQDRQERKRLDEYRRAEELRRQEQRKAEEERIRILEEQRRVEEQSRSSNKRLEEDRIRAQEEKRRTEERRQEEERIRILNEQRRVEEERIRILDEQRRRVEEQRRTGGKQPEEDRIRAQEEKRRAEELRRLEEQRRRQEESWRVEEERRKEEERRRYYQQVGGGTEEERRRYQQGGQSYGSEEERWRAEEERRRYYEESRRRQQETVQGGHTGQGQTSGERVLTGYFDEQGNPHNLPRGSSGQVVYNRTYTLERTTTIPIDLPRAGAGEIDLNIGDLGSGFTVQTLDLNNNRNDLTASRGSSSGSSSGQSGYRTDDLSASRGASSGSSSGYRTDDLSASRGSSSGSNSGQSGYRREWKSEGGYTQSGQIPATFFHNSLEEDRRVRRAVMGDPYKEMEALIKCNSTNCVYVRCVVGVLEKDKEVAIALRSRLNVRAIKDLTNSQAVKVSSMMVGKITKLPYLGEAREEVLRRHEIFTDIPGKEAELVTEVAPLWIYVLSAVAGIVMLLLLIWILSKCGFFKRNRPSSAPERQPLNRNGYHSGDEAL